MLCLYCPVQCADQSYYTGITFKLKRRIALHNSRIKSCLQNSKVPVKLLYWELFNLRTEAAKREKEIKGWTRKKKENLINMFTLNPTKLDEVRK